MTDLLGSLDYQNLVNWQHPLNRGRVAWWLNLPQRRGGNTFRDIAKRNHGTLTNGPVWTGPRGRPGGWGALEFSGSAFVATPSQALGAAAGANLISFGAWIRPATVGGYETVCEGVVSTGTTRQLAIFLGGPNSLWVAVGGIGGNEFTCSPAFAANVGQRLLLTSDGTTVRAYRNGVLVGSRSTEVIGSGIQGVVLQLGRQVVAGGTQYSGLMDDVSLWPRTLSATDVREDYDQSRRGYPDLLNRYRPAAWSVPEAAPPTGFNPAWASRNVHVIGAGAL